MSPDILLVPSTNTTLPLRFDVVNQLVIDSYQIYAVEKWIVDRNRPIVTLAVYTGNPSHKVPVALSPSPCSQPPDNSHCIHTLRLSFPPRSIRGMESCPPAPAQGWCQAERRSSPAFLPLSAHPTSCQTPHGVIMTTSLAHFRSDYTIVHIPSGNFFDIQQQLYANINLLRMGCSGRSALSLDEPRYASLSSRKNTLSHLPQRYNKATFLHNLLHPGPNILQHQHLPFPIPTQTENPLKIKVS
jgi:hypothetical protein